MASYLALIAVLAVGLTSVRGETCTACQTTYDDAVAATSDNQVKCNAAKAYTECLIAATVGSAGCDTFGARVTTIINDRNNYNTGGVTCAALTDSCLCQMSYYTVAKVSTATATTRCPAAAAYYDCAHTGSAVSCDGTTTNAAVTEMAVTALKDDCSICAACAIRVSIASLLFVVLGMFLKN